MGSVATPPSATAGFGSIAALQDAHVELIAAPSTAETAVDIDPDTIREFMERAQATGAELSGPSARRKAQSIIDYWAAEYLVRSKRDRGRIRGPILLARYEPTFGAHLTEGKPCPYNGLEAFTELDAQRFHGRSEAIGHLVEMIKQHTVVIVTGASGCGKSSLVRAGLAQALQTFDTDIHFRFLPVVIPGGDPITSLARSIASADDAAQLNKIRQSILSAPAALGRTLHEAHGPSLLIIDQLEELFTLCADDVTRNQFAAALASLGPEHRVILVVRQDFLGRVENLKPFSDVAATPSCRFTPPAFSARELGEVIHRPAEDVGLRFDEGVAEELVKEVLGEPAALPLLQFALMRLWSARDGDRVTWTVYRTVKRPQEALEHAAEDVYNKLSIGEKKVAAQQIILLLVQPSVGQEFVRRRMTRADLWNTIGEPQRTNEVVAAFAREGLLRITSAGGPADDRVEVAHEALIRNWPRLRTWIDNKRQTSKEEIELTTRARRWQELNRSTSYLLTGDELKEAFRHKGKAPEIDVFLLASTAQESRDSKRRFFRGVGVGMACAALVAATAGGSYFIYAKKVDAIKQKISNEEVRLLRSQREKEAEIQRRVAELNDAIVKLSGTLEMSSVSRNTMKRELASVNEFADLFSKGRPALSKTGVIWLGSNQRPNIQIRKGPDLVPVKPDSVVVNQTYIARFNLALRDALPTDTNKAGASMGVVPRGTEIVLKSVPKSYVRGDQPQYHAEILLPNSVSDPTIFFQFANAERARASEFKAILRQNQFQTPGAEQTDLAKGTLDVRYNCDADKDAAERLALTVVPTALTQLRYEPEKAVVKRLDPTRFPCKLPNTVELWIDFAARHPE